MEQSASACRNGLDDDGDGQTDCDDAECIATSACEGSAEACRNGIDDDRNGATDCEDARCLAVEGSEAPCAEGEIECDPVSSEGCVRGLTCSVEPGGGGTVTTFCRRAGGLEDGAACARTPDCQSGLQCGFGFCTPGCGVDADCPAHRRCLPFSDERPLGICTVPCSPLSPAEQCGSELCVSLHVLSFTYDEGGGLFTCLTRDSASPFLGTGAEGEACAPRVNQSSTARSLICGDGLTCVPQVDGTHVCRDGCLARLGGGGFGCDPPWRCVPAYPVDPQHEGASLPGICDCDQGDTCP